ncbi:angiotensin-converting enzyme-like [Condylostylus longicornis]|uniref:angiotensin-converting enzyme-like n=1 Tax=Condylostylus longicornis TaxID=2530218 RepID=UPI00244E3C62|nr:angiotensin-converting enzyme-like [Condylostylus longicornis]
MFKLLYSVLLGVLVCSHMKSKVWGDGDVTASVRSYINRVNNKMFLLYEEIHRLTFNKHQYEYLGDLDVIGRTIDEIASLTKEAQTFNLGDVKDPELKSALLNLQKSSYLYILGGDEYNNLMQILDTMMMPAIRRGLCEYNNFHNCDLAYIPDIKQMIASNSYNSEQLLYYWTQWREEIEKKSRPQFPKFIDLYKQAAVETGVTPVEFLYNYYGGDTSIIDNMKHVMNDLMSFYEEFHAYVRHELSEIFGKDIVSKTGPIPDHIFQVISMQAWKKDSILPQPYPDQRLPNLKAGLQNQNVNPTKMINIIEQYYTSMGLSSIPRNIRSNFKKKSDNELRSECKAEIYDETPNIRMEYCPQVNIKKFLQMHGYMGRVHYAYEKRDLPFHFFSSYKFEDAVGEALILSASSPSHLTNLGIVEDSTYTPELEMNRLFRMGVHTIFNIPKYYVHVKLIEDILNGTTTTDNINVHYWKLMEQYAGVEPPINRNIEALDLPYKFFEDLKANRLVTKFVSEILGYQFYESLCIIAGKYGFYAQDKPLHDCNLEGHNEVGRSLKNMMKLGSKKRWREVLNVVNGNNNGLSAQGLLHYYSPLRSWLQQQIQIKKINIGWTPSEKAVNLRLSTPR